jgi:ATP-binding cassette subfamily F protein 3
MIDPRVVGNFPAALFIVKGSGKRGPNLKEDLNMIVNCHQVKKYHGANLVLENISLDIRTGERIGLIGRNGTGKSTLLQLLTGQLQPDEGQIAIRKGAKIGYLQQIPQEEEENSVYEVLARGFKEVQACKSQMTELEKQMADPEVLPDENRLNRILKQYAALQDVFEQGGGYDMDFRIEQVANGLRIPQEQFSRAFSSLSGGEKTKVGLAALLVEQPTPAASG